MLPLLDYLLHPFPAASLEAPAQRSGARVMNFLWLNLDLPAKPDPADGSLRQPLPQKYIENVRKAGADNPDTDIVLWMDRKRLTQRQWNFLEHSLAEDRPNVRLRNLRAIPAYAQEALYNRPETDPSWREGTKDALIWRQVDAAKILVSLQGNYDQTFFSDLDHAHLGIASDKVQGMLRKHGIMIGSGGTCSAVWIENQLWGFERSRRPFMEGYYRSALRTAYLGENAWDVLVRRVQRKLMGKERIPLEEICLPIESDGTHAEQPGHAWRSGYNAKETPPDMVDKGELHRLFNAKSSGLQKQETPVPANAPTVTAPPAAAAGL